MFDIVIPTIWAPSIESIDKLINSLSECSIVSNIIIINNNPNKIKDRYNQLPKIKEFTFDNIYVNQAWNFGVDNSLSENICLLNDDIHFNISIFEFLYEKLNQEDVKIIGVCKSSYNLQSDQEFSIEKISIRNRGWGCFICFKKENFNPIPKDLLIHFGDDYLIKKSEGFVWKLKGLKIKSEISVSVDFDPKFQEIIKQDNINSLKYELPWSNDY